MTQGSKNTQRFERVGCISTLVLKAANRVATDSHNFVIYDACYPMSLWPFFRPAGDDLTSQTPNEEKPDPTPGHPTPSPPKGGRQTDRQTETATETERQRETETSTSAAIAT